MTELKSCPFCGEAAALNTRVVRDRFVRKEVCIVYCGRCKADGPHPDMPAHYSDESGDLDTRCQDDAIAAWNRRSGGERAAVVEALLDSQYLAGVSAGWNAAQADDPNAAKAAIFKSREGYLRPLHRKGRQNGTRHAP